MVASKAKIRILKAFKREQILENTRKTPDTAAALSYIALSYTVLSYTVLSYTALSYIVLSYTVLSCHRAPAGPLSIWLPAPAGPPQSNQNEKKHFLCFF